MKIIEELLSDEELHAVQTLMAQADWKDGNATAGTQSAQAKRNQQLAEVSSQARAAQHIVLQALGRNASFIGAALPKRIYPPLFNRYAGDANRFGDHIDNAVRTHPVTGQSIRTDLAATLFLSDPHSYDGGELVITHALGSTQVKLPAGSMVLYGAGTVHRVEPVTRGERVASFFWLESMVRNTEQRELLAGLDESIQALRAQHGESTQTVQLVGSYHNLLRMWAEAA